MAWMIAFVPSFCGIASTPCLRSVSVSGISFRGYTYYTQILLETVSGSESSFFGWRLVWESLQTNISSTWVYFVCIDSLMFRFAHAHALPMHIISREFHIAFIKEKTGAPNLYLMAFTENLERGHGRLCNHNDKKPQVWIACFSFMFFILSWWQLYTLFITFFLAKLHNHLLGTLLVCDPNANYVCMLTCLLRDVNVGLKILHCRWVGGCCTQIHVKVPGHVTEMHYSESCKFLTNFTRKIWPYPQYSWQIYDKIARVSVYLFAYFFVWMWILHVEQIGVIEHYLSTLSPS